MAVGTMKPVVFDFKNVTHSSLIISMFKISIHFNSFFIIVSRYFTDFSSLSHCGWLISVLQSLVHHVGASFGFLSLVINSMICRWLVLLSDWFVILRWRLMVMLIQSFLNTSTRLISVLQSLVHHVCASFGGFFRWWLIHSFVGDWCYNLIGLSYWTGDWWWCSSIASSTLLLD